MTANGRRRGRQILVKHSGVYRANGKEEIAKRIEKRMEDLSIKLEVDGFNTDKQAYYMHPLGMIGWLAATVGEFDWFETPLVKLIVSKESKDFLMPII